MQELLQEYVYPHFGTFLSLMLSGFAGFVFGRRKQRAETDSVVIENAVNTLKYYQDMVDDLGGKLKTAISELDEAMKRIKELEDTVELLTDELKKYKQLNRKKEN